jgi:hypothetical protein
MEIKGGSLSATYNENGKLISVIEKNINSVYLFCIQNPGWQIVNTFVLPKRDILKKKSKKEKTSVN